MTPLEKQVAEEFIKWMILNPQIHDDQINRLERIDITHSLYRLTDEFVIYLTWFFSEKGIHFKDSDDGYNYIISYNGKKLQTVEESATEQKMALFKICIDLLYE